MLVCSQRNIHIVVTSVLIDIDEEILAINIILGLGSEMDHGAYNFTGQHPDGQGKKGSTLLGNRNNLGQRTFV